MRLVNFLATGSLKCRWNCDGSKSCVKAYLPSFFQYPPFVLRLKIS